MRVPVMYKDGKMGYADQHEINRLISTRQIIRFLRADGWAIVGSDAVRTNGSSYQGPGRREDDSARALD
ncbi:MAG TPA: hypothetical protein VN328_13640 [Thermodesulfovibrionales bacterium]|nr:hypothetical protein [Thermodesulfovibrionales bacterium]